MSGIYSTKIPTLDTLEDVDIVDVVDDNLLQYNSTTREWENAVPGNAYFIKVLLGSDDNTGLDDATDYLLGGLVAQFSGTDFDYNNTDWNEGTSTWTCSKKGIYRINAQVAFRLTSDADRIRSCVINIFNSGSVVSSNTMKIESDSTTADDFIEYNSVINTLLEFDIGETMQMKLDWEVWGTSETMIIRASDDVTYLCINRVS